MLFALIHCLLNDVVAILVAMFTLLEAKGVAAAVLAGGSLIAGLLPKWLGLAERIEHSLLLSVILCFGAGVLLATSIIHILHDTVAALPVWGEIYFCSGFMILYFVDELVQYWCLVTVENDERSSTHHHSDPSEVDRLLNDNGDHSKYGSIKKDESAQKILKSGQQSSTDYQWKQRKILHEEDGAVDEDNIEFKCKGSDLNPTQSVTSVEQSIKTESKLVKKVGLIIAFCTHSLLEGLAVGTQPTSSKVILLLLAVSCHKLVITFCLGAELMSDGSSFAMLFFSLSIYAVCSGLGVVIGTVLNSTNTSVIPVLQGLAGGSLLYITVGEILPRERLHKEHCIMPKLTGLIQFLFVLFGIIPIAVMNIYTEKNDTSP
ncbi:zinc/iron regulated transporter-related protein 88E [Lycorma delicatula]|uniref:zinc/iron regulated transporter-related protein 88E n=1 Tax=Lycorma delicatula TaxID=130591 RepID=UPI003F50E27E